MCGTDEFVIVKCTIYYNKYNLDTGEIVSSYSEDAEFDMDDFEWSDMSDEDKKYYILNDIANGPCGKSLPDDVEAYDCEYSNPVSRYSGDCW